VINITFTLEIGNRGTEWWCILKLSTFKLRNSLLLQKLSAILET
jgi:hypothetical protein